MLSGNISIEDDDWDSVRQSHAALTRDLERIFLSIGQGGNDFGGGSPKSANDQTVQQDGNYGFNAVTTDMLDELDARIGAEIDALPSVTYPISIANGGTGGLTVTQALLNLGLSPNTYAAYGSSATWTVPAGVTRVLIHCVGGGGGSGGQTLTSSADVFVASSSGGATTSALSTRYIYTGKGGDSSPYAMAVCDVTPGDTLSLTVGTGGAGAASGSTLPGTRGTVSTVSGTNINISCNPSTNSIVISGSMAHPLAKSYIVDGTYGSAAVRTITTGSSPSLTPGVGGKSPLHPYGSGADGVTVSSLSDYAGTTGYTGAVVLCY